uniref:Putative ixodes 10 kDa peptide protein n=1 Tax=Ixodes ricinus TaxID=34613 RepID=A0A0K8R6I5_IXORI
MRFVLFAVVLILPESEGEGFSFVYDKCYLTLMYKKGDIFCQISGYDNYNGLTYETCKLGCGVSEVQLPKEACPRGKLHNPCTERELKKLQTWAEGLENKRANIKDKLCND